MATKGTPDVYLLFGLQGGDSLEGASGKLIESQLTHIIQQLEDKIVFSLKTINADKALEKLTKDVNKTLNDISQKSEVSLNIKFNEKSVETAITALENKIKKTVGANINVTPNINVVAGNGNVQANSSTKASTKTSNSITSIDNTIKTTQKDIKETKKVTEEASVVVDETVNLIKKFVKESASALERAREDLTISTKNSRGPLSLNDVYAILGTWGDKSKVGKRLSPTSSVTAEGYTAILNEVGVDIFGHPLTGKKKNSQRDIKKIFEELAAKYSDYFELELDKLSLTEDKGRKRLLSSMSGKTAFADVKEYQKAVEEVVKLLNLDVSDNKITISLKQLRDLVNQITSDDEKILETKNNLNDLLNKTATNLLSKSSNVSQAVKNKINESLTVTDSVTSQVAKQEAAAIAKETEEAKQDVKELESSAVSVAENVEKTVDAVTESVEKAAISIADIKQVVKEKTKALTDKSFTDDPNKSIEDLKDDKVALKFQSRELLDRIKLYEPELDSGQLSKLYSIINNLKTLWGAIYTFETIGDLFSNRVGSFEKYIDEIKKTLYADAFPNILRDEDIAKLDEYKGLSMAEIYKSFTKVKYKDIKKLETLEKYLTNGDSEHTIEGYTSYLNSKGKTITGKKDKDISNSVEEVERELLQLSDLLKKINTHKENVIEIKDGNISQKEIIANTILKNYKGIYDRSNYIYNAVNSDDYKNLEKVFSQIPVDIEPVKEAASEVKTEITSVATVAESLKETAQEVATTAKPAVESVKDKVDDVAQAEQKATDNAEKLTEQIAQTNDKAVPALEKAEQEFKGNATDVSSITEVSSAAQPAIEATTKKVEELAQAEQKATDNAEKLTEQIEKTDDKAVPALDNVGNKLEELEKVYREFERNGFKDDVFIGDLYGQDAVDAAREIVKAYKDLNEEEIAFLKGDTNGASWYLAEEAGIRDEILSKFKDDYQEYQYYKNKESQDISNTSDEINKLDDTVKESAKDLKEYKDATDDAAESTDKLGNAAEKSKNKIPKSVDNRITTARGRYDHIESVLGLSQVNISTPAIRLYEELYNKITKLREAMDSDDYSSIDGINNYDEALRETNALLTQADELFKIVKKDIDVYNSGAKDASRKSQRDQNIANLFPAGASADSLNNYTSPYARMEQRLATATKNLDNLNNSQLSAVSDDINTLYNRLKRVSKLIETLKSGALTEPSEVANVVSEINDQLGITEKTIKKITDTADNIPTDAMTSIVEKYNQALAEYRATPGADKFGDLYNLDYIDTSKVKNIETAKTRVVALTKETERLTKAKADLDNASKRESTTAARVNEIYQKAYDYYNKYYAGISRNKDLDNRWTTLLKDLNNGMYNNNAEGARQALTELQVQSKQANVEVTGLWSNLKKLFSAHFGSFSILTIIGSIRNGLRSMYQDVLEIDKAMTELRKVTDLTEQQYKSFQIRVADTARDVGGSIADTIRSTADYSRLGFNLPDSESLAKAALVYKNVGDGLENIDEASESIISTIKAFSDIDASDAMSIIDKFNEVGNNFAISSAGIGTALKKSAASLASANNTLDESIALITAGNAVVQNPETVGGKYADFKSSYNG